MTQLTLTIVVGPLRGTTHTAAPGDTLRVGRGEDCDWTVMDPMMSREHFEVARGQQSFQVRDLRSTNGTRVNGQPLDPTGLPLDLRHGDSIAAGNTSFEVRVTGSQLAPAEGPAARRPASDFGDARPGFDEDSFDMKNRETWIPPPGDSGRSGQ